MANDFYLEGCALGKLFEWLLLKAAYKLAAVAL